MKKKQKAFTMIEVLVAMLVLAIGLLGLAAMTVVVLRSNVLSQQISEATTITGDLMESLKLRSISELTDCASTGNVISVGSSCSIITESGLSNLGSDYYPLDPTGSCEVDGIVSDLAGGTPGAFDSVTANLISFPASGTSAASFCTEFDNLPKGRYVRFYRSFDPDPADGRDERRLIVVVLWKDRFGKWRNLNLETTRAN